MAASDLEYATQVVIDYIGLPVLVLGLVGNCLNIVVLLSLNTFRQRPCAFFLTVMSFVNIGQLLASLLSRILISGFGVDLTTRSQSVCKLRTYCLQVCTLMSYTCMCLATLEQYLATAFRVRWQRYLTMSKAHRSCLVLLVVWLLHGIPTLVWYDITSAPVLRRPVCSSANESFEMYITDVYVLVLTGVLPLLVTIVFGSLAFRNVRQIPYRTVPLVRRELDKQLTSMVLVQVVHNVLVITPHVVFVAVMYFIDLTVKVLVDDLLQFCFIFTDVLQYLYYASPFYIYICVSQRFRQQFVHVITRIYATYKQRPVIVVNNLIEDS